MLKVDWNDPNHTADEMENGQEKSKSSYFPG